MSDEIKSRKRHYETVFIISPSVQESVVKDITSKVTKTIEEARGHLLRLDDWGKKKMAHSIEKHAMGRYGYLRFVGTETLLKAIERHLKLDASVLRFLSIRLSAPLSDSEVDTLVERAPKEPTSAPSFRGDEDDFGAEVAYS